MTSKQTVDQAETCVRCPEPATEVAVWHTLDGSGTGRDPYCDDHANAVLVAIRKNDALRLDGIADAHFYASW